MFLNIKMTDRIVVFIEIVFLRANITPKIKIVGQSYTMAQVTFESSIIIYGRWRQD